MPSDSAGPATTAILELSILVGRGMTDLDLRAILSVRALAIVLMAGAAFFLLARGYWFQAESEEP